MSPSTNPAPAPTPAPGMPQEAPRLLFIPVSGAFGMGEFARCLNLALACRERWPQARIRFLLSEQAPYAKNLAFEAVLLPSSPTFHTPRVVREIEEFAPTAVIFDNAGRSAQLAAARRSGAAVVYISARARQRRKAFRLRWARMLDEHWIAWPRFMAGPLTRIERLKLRLTGGPVVRYLDCILPRLATGAEQELLQRVPAAGGDFVLIVPGGGTGHPRAREAVAAFTHAARALAEAGVPVVFIAPGAAAMPAMAGMSCLDLLPLAELLALLRRARVALLNGGDTLIQAIALQVPAVAVPIAADQPARIRAALRESSVRASSLDALSMAAAVRALFDDAVAREALRAAARRLALVDALAESVEALAQLMRGP